MGCQEYQQAEVTHAVRGEEEANSVGTRRGIALWNLWGLRVDPEQTRSKKVASEMSRGGAWLDPLNGGGV